MLRYVVCLLLMFAARAGFAQGSSDGWVSTNLPMINSAIFSTGDGNMLYAWTDVTFASSSDNGVTWGPLPTPSFTPSCLLSRDNIVLAGGEQDLYISLDSARHWGSLNALPNTHVRALGLSGTVIVAISDSGIYASQDAYHWTRTYFDPAAKSISGLAISGDTIYWSSTAGLLASYDKGYRWTKLDSSHIFTDIAPATGWLFATDSNWQVLRSNSGGHSWEPITTPLYLNAITALGRYVFASDLGAASTKIVASVDGGTNWSPINFNGSPHRAYKLFVRGSSLFAASYNVGLWYRPLSEIIQSLSVGGASSSESSLDVYPHAAQSEVTIHFALTSTDRPRITIYDVSGRTILALDLGLMEAGGHDIEVALPHASAVYLARMSCTDGIAAARFVMVK